jgi:hypothetical protein
MDNVGATWGPEEGCARAHDDERLVDRTGELTNAGDGDRRRVRHAERAPRRVRRGQRSKVISQGRLRVAFHDGKNSTSAAQRPLEWLRDGKFMGETRAEFDADMTGREEDAEGEPFDDGIVGDRRCSDVRMAGGERSLPTAGANTIRGDLRSRKVGKGAKRCD